MEKSPSSPSKDSGGVQSGTPLVFVVPRESLVDEPGNDATLSDFFGALWRGRIWLLVITGLFSVLSIVYVLSATEWYSSSVLLAPAQDRSASGQQLAGQLGGLASLAGINLNGNSDNSEALAVLRSRDFARSFINQLDLASTLLDQKNQDTLADRNSESVVDIREAVQYFRERVLTVSEDSSTGLVTLEVEWIDPAVAAEWANSLVERLNEDLRQRDLIAAEKNIAFLESALSGTSLIVLEQSIGRLLESEMQRLMLARGNEEFAFRILDSAEVPRNRSRPQRTLTVIVATILGGLVGVLFVLLRVGGRVTSLRQKSAEE